VDGPDPRRGLWELVESAAVERPDAVFVVDEHDRLLRFGELHTRAVRVAAWLEDQGWSAGETVSWQLPTRIDTVVIAAALARIGVVQSPLLPLYRQRELAFILGQNGARHIITPGTWRGYDYTALARSALSDLDRVDGVDGVDVIDVGDGVPERAEPGRAEPGRAAPAGVDELRWIFYTSGTTADPKGARHTEGALWATARGLVERLEVTEDDCASIVFPFSHIGGLTWMYAGLMVGCRLIFVEAFDRGAVGVLRRHRVTLAGSGPPFLLRYLDEQRALPAGERLFDHLRAFVSGGAVTPPHLHHQLKAECGGTGVLGSWGLTEAPIVTGVSPSQSDHALADTVGPPMPGVEIRFGPLDDGDAAGSRAAETWERGPGEILVKAPQMMLGYVDAALDRAAFTADGWFRTGDIGCLDDEGNVVITGRLKEVIIRNGENISAREVEDLLYTCDGVAEVAIIGMPDPRSGELVCAVVVPRDAPVTLDALCAHLRAEGVMPQKWPERLVIVDQLPRNALGKVLKQQLRTRVLDT